MLSTSKVSERRVLSKVRDARTDGSERLAMVVPMNDRMSWRLAFSIEGFGYPITSMRDPPR